MPEIAARRRHRHGSATLLNVPLQPGRFFDRLRLKNVRCFADTEIPLDRRVTVLIGGNGSGKTTLIEALASLAHGDSEGLPVFPLRRNTKTGDISLHEAGRAKPSARWILGPNGEKRQRLPERPLLLAYGRYRRVFAADEAPQGSQTWRPAELLDQLAHHAGLARTVTLNRVDNNLLRDLSRYLVALNFGRTSDPRLETVWQRLNASLPEIGPGLEEIRMEARRPGEVAMVVRNGMSLELSELSDGYQALLVVILDLMLRYPYVFTDLENPLAGDAVVSIDEVDLHLHPRWQRTVVRQLLSLFPNTQFILTTHAPLVVQGAIDWGQSVVTLEEHHAAVVASRVGPRVLRRMRGSEVGSLLYEDHLFGVSSRYSTKYSDLERRVDELQKLISAGKATDQDHRELTRCLEQLEDLVSREDERRADGSTVARLAKLEAAFVKRLLAQLAKARK